MSGKLSPEGIENLRLRAVARGKPFMLDDGEILLSHIAAIDAELDDARAVRDRYAAVLDAIAALHVPAPEGSPHYGFCSSCDDFNPCETARALADRDVPRVEKP